MRTHHRGAASYGASLACATWIARITTPRTKNAHKKIVQTPLLRRTQTINGRAYVIEVRPVSEDRWRAQVVRRPGGMTSLMPFYGTTPDDAAQLLAGWLARASEPRKAV
jgi:hypothetical protein